MTSFPSMRVAMPTAPSSGGKAPFSGSKRGVSGIEGISPSSTTGVEGANFCRCLVGVYQCRCYWSVERRPTGRIRDDWHLVIITDSNNGMQRNVASTIMHLHPICDNTGCSSGMKRDATRFLWSQRWFQSQGTCLWQVLVQIYLKGPDGAQIAT